MTAEQAFNIVAARLEEDENRPADYTGFDDTGFLFWLEQGVRIGNC